MVLKFTVTLEIFIYLTSELEALIHWYKAIQKLYFQKSCPQNLGSRISHVSDPLDCY